MSWITEFLHDAFAMPTAVFSVLLILVSLYWGVKLLGIFDLDALEAVTDSADALGDAADLADAADLTDAADAADVTESGPGLLGGLSFGDVPRTLVWSLVAVFGWCFSFFGSRWVPGFEDLMARAAWVSLVAAGLSLGLAVLAAAVAVQPLRRLIETPPGTRRRDLVGRLCTVRTLRVDEEFGQAEVDRGAMLVQVRAAIPNTLTRGSRALIFDYDPEREVFLIAPENDALG